MNQLPACQCTPERLKGFEGFASRGSYRMMYPASLSLLAANSLVISA